MNRKTASTTVSAREIDRQWRVGDLQLGLDEVVAAALAATDLKFGQVEGMKRRKSRMKLGK